MSVTLPPGPRWMVIVPGPDVTRPEFGIPSRSWENAGKLLPLGCSVAPAAVIDRRAVAAAAINARIASSLNLMVGAAHCFTAPKLPMAPKAWGRIGEVLVPATLQVPAVSCALGPKNVPRMGPATAIGPLSPARFPLTVPV